MKKILFLGFIALTALTVTSCSNDEVMEAVPQKQAIEFGTYLGRDAQARAAELETTGLQEKGFGVFASYTTADWSASNTPNFMYNQQVTYSSTKWTYSPVKYWPEDQSDKISFFAYGPYLNNETSPVATIATMTANNVTGAPKLTFIQSLDVTKMVDFVAGVKMNQSGTNNYNDVAPTPVDFNLKHELTRLNFKAKLAAAALGGGENYDAKTRINIKDVKIVAGGKFVKQADYTFATADANSGTWSSPIITTTGEDLELASILNKIEHSDASYPDDNTVGTYAESGVFVTSSDISTAVNLFKNDEYVFLIPPGNGVGLAKDETISVTFTYDIITYDTQLDGQHSVTTAVKTVTLPTGDNTADPVIANTLIQGKAYNFTFTFGLHEVKVSATVTGWGEEGDGGDQDVNWTDQDA